MEGTWGKQGFIVAVLQLRHVGQVRLGLAVTDNGQRLLVGSKESGVERLGSSVTPIGSLAGCHLEWPACDIEEHLSKEAFWWVLGSAGLRTDWLFTYSGSLAR